MKKVWLLSIRLCLYTVLAAGLLAGCKKVDDHATIVLSQPWLSDSYTQMSGSRLTPVTWTYPTSLVVGDTVMLIGNLFPYRPGTQIMIGDVPVKIIDTAQYTPNFTTYTPQLKLDGVRFIVTKEMGIGKNRPVTITANGITIHGNPVTINFLNGNLSRTDTTLWVDRLAQWLPDNVSDYLPNGYLLVRSIHNDKDGNMYFDNKFSVQAVTNGTAHTLIKAGDHLQDDKGSNFTIKQILGSTVTFDGDAVYFSAEVLDNKTDEATIYIFRLCKMNLASKSITTINRTLVANGTADSEDGSPFQGNVASLKVVAINLTTDINNNLYYANVYAPGSSWDDHSYWYNVGISIGTTDADFTSGIILICRLDVNGKVHGLMSADYSYPSTGFPVSAPTYTADPSGKYLYGYYTNDLLRFQLLQYDIMEDENGGLLKTYNFPYSFHSYESDPAYKKTQDVGFIVDPASPELCSMLQFADGTILASSNASLGNYNIITKSAYCYAGTEIGLGGNAPQPAQNQTTGSAKWVNFSGITLIGQDKTGAVYYCKGIRDYTGGVVFYKLHPKKN